MSESNHDDDLLLIRCPSCGQRFKVEQELRERTVECGGCEHRFRIDDEVIVRGKRFYPGENRDPSLNYFHRPSQAAGQIDGGLERAHYADAPDPVSFEPTSPQRIIGGIIGVAGMVFVALLLMFSSSRGGALDGVTTEKRLLMAGFMGLLGVVLLVYANPRSRWKAVLAGLVMGAGLLALPWIYSENSTPLEGRPIVPEEWVVEPLPNGKEGPGDSIDAMKAHIGTGPLEKEIERLAVAGDSKTAVGLWLRDLQERNRLLVRDYILRVTGASLESHFYPRGRGDFLMVVTGVDLLLEEVAELSASIGEVKNVRSEISVIEVQVDNGRFVEGPLEKLTDPDNPSFYFLNKRELESVDLARVARAVKRLKDAEPKVFRSDITRLLISLLDSDGVDCKPDICEALAVWSEEAGPAGDAALEVVKDLHASGEVIPVEMIRLIVDEENAGVLPILDELWVKKPNQWEALYADLGNVAEETLIQRFPETTGGQRHSVVRLLGKVGGKDSLPVLKAALQGVNGELRIMIKKAMDSIVQRTGG